MDTMKKTSLIVILYIFIVNAFSQEIPNDFKIIKEIYPSEYVAKEAGNLGALGSTFYISKDEKYLMLSYGYGPTVISIYRFGTWEFINSFKLSKWLYDIYTMDDIVFTVGDNAIRQEIIYQIYLKTNYSTTISEIATGASTCTRYKYNGYDTNKNYYFNRINGKLFRVYSKEQHINNENIQQITDNIPPVITLTYPDITRGFKLIEQEKLITIKGNVSDISGILEVLINGQEASVDAAGNFSKRVLLAFGNNSFIVKATDLKQNTATKEFTIERVSDQDEPVDTIAQAGLTSMQQGKFYALIIGNSTYQDQSINSLYEPVNDATKLYNVLTTKYTFEYQNMTFLKNATYVQIIEAFDDLSNKVTPVDNLLVFYAGHGWWDDAKRLGYWLPVDARKSSTAFWIANSRISDFMSSINSRHTLLIADACFSGSIFKTRSAFSDAQPSINKLYDLPSRKAMTSGNLKEVPDKSVFLQFLIKRLTENTEKYISSDMLFASFRQAVLNNGPTEPQYGTIQNAGDEGGEFIFIQK
jgi:hypothetical protein